MEVWLPSVDQYFFPSISLKAPGDTVSSLSYMPRSASSSLFIPAAARSKGISAGRIATPIASTLVFLTNHAILTTIITMKAATTMIPVRKKIFHWFFRSSICFCAFCLYSSAVSSSFPFFQRIPFHLASVPFFIVTVRHFPANGNILSDAGSLNYCLSYPDRSGHWYR